MSKGRQGRKAKGAAAMGSPISRGGKEKRRRQRHGRRLLLSLHSAVAFLLAVVLFSWRRYYAASDAREEGTPRSNGGAEFARRTWEEGLPPDDESARRAEAAPPKPGEAKGGSPETNVRAASLDTVVRYLVALADSPPSVLWGVLGVENDDRGDDPFSLRDLENGKCPGPTLAGSREVEWLPPRPHNSAAVARQYRSNISSLKGGGVRLKRAQMERYDAKNEVALWYEHMSKAGGTTFCGLAKSNMLQWQVPRYHCMPRKGDRMDGRVGSWPNDELVEYLAENRHAIVSNEWEPFSLEKLELSGRRLDGIAPAGNRDDGQPDRPRLLFLTTLRDTLDRLLSAYTFFALTTTEGRRGEENDGPTFDQWIGNMLSRAGKYSVGKGRAFRSNVARMNHVVWRFSGGALTHSRTPGRDEWRPPFETAIRALAQHDLILPMDVMTKEWGKTALSRLLGWERFDVSGRGQGDKGGGQVVTQGGIKNSNAREYFGKEKYRALWEENWLDNILCLWCRAVFLARLHCEDVILDS